MCSYNEQDWTELAKLTEEAGADALEVRRRKRNFVEEFFFVYFLAQSFMSTWNGFVEI